MEIAATMMYVMPVDDLLLTALFSASGRTILGDTNACKSRANLSS